MTQVDIDVAVVGAGPAGSSAALRLAQRGLSVALVERGNVPGEKNLSGGVLYTHSLRELLGGVEVGTADAPSDNATGIADAPVERRITRHVTTFLQADSAVSLDYTDDALTDVDDATGLPNAVTVLRARFDPWLAGLAESAGAMLMPGMRVDSLATEPGPGGPRVVGIVSDGMLMRTHAVIAADGVNSFLAKGAGLRADAPPSHVGLGVKAVIRMDPHRIEDRFGVSADDGAAHAIVGDATLGVAGGAFLYTNRDSLSVGIVVRLDDLVASGRTAREVFDHLLGHPGLARYLDGGEVMEYGSHLVAEGGLAGVGEVVHDGLVLVGDAAGITINSGLVLRGMDLAIDSGLRAGDAVADAIRAGDTSAAGLAHYRDALAASVTGRDLRTFARTPELLHRPGPYGAWGATAAEVLRGAYRLDGTPRRRLPALVRDAVAGSGVSLRTWLRDLREIGRSL